MAFEAVVVLIIVVLALAWAYFTAQRLNTLHIRTDAARAQLTATLDRRAAVVAVLDPELEELAQRAEMTTDLAERIEVEQEMSNAIAQAFPDKPAQLADAEARVQLAHRFYNEAVRDTRALRLRPLVRIFRLGGTAPLPEFFEY